VAHLVDSGERVGMVQVRLFRPLPAEALVAAIPVSAQRIAVLDRTKEPGSLGEPLFLDVLAALAEDGRGTMPTVIGGRYGLGSKEFTPGMVAGVFTNPGGFYWPMFPLLGWGIGVAFHAWDVYAPEKPPEDRIRREMERLSHR
jgi:pyruvate/2-oxoacid:ferredoxin oxidoreductase alpha subunit